MEDMTTSGGRLANHPTPKTRVSVCLAACNGARFIGRQVQSILDQLGPADELIVVDDASSDDTVAVVESFSDHRIKLIRQRRNRGVVATFRSRSRM